MGGNVTLSGATPEVDFQDTDDSTRFRIRVQNSKMAFQYGDPPINECGRIVSPATAELYTPVIVEAAAASESAFIMSPSSGNDVRIRASTSDQLQVGTYSGGWSEILIATGGANPMLEVTGCITNSTTGGQVIVFANDLASGDIARFYSGANLVASILNDGLVDLSAGGLRLGNCGSFPGSPTSVLYRNIYFKDDPSTPQIGVVTDDGVGGYSMVSATLN